jgi:hypothetical protein
VHEIPGVIDHQRVGDLADDRRRERWPSRPSPAGSSARSPERPGQPTARARPNILLRCR